MKNLKNNPIEDKEKWVETVYATSDSLPTIAFTESDKQKLYNLFYLKNKPISTAELLKVAATVVFIIMLNIICIQKIKQTKTTQGTQSIYENYFNNQ